MHNQGCEGELVQECEGEGRRCKEEKGKRIWEARIKSCKDLKVNSCKDVVKVKSCKEEKGKNAQSRGEWGKGTRGDEKVTKRKWKKEKWKCQVCLFCRSSFLYNSCPLCTIIYTSLHWYTMLIDAIDQWSWKQRMIFTSENRKSQGWFQMKVLFSVDELFKISCILDDNWCKWVTLRLPSLIIGQQ